ncbi:hypothetical protein RDI86_02570 [Cellulosimicrobium sp. XJ-DQ-B-000]|uniref:hypothetical protein n=1 Tax=Cellulosimicrobium sp. XJ-DQ-B-000 TaxID=3072182 RepID=UPI0000382CB7|nr:hypothetical protein [Cellulosimicrobium sp. XJ-DQ-B-000]MDQ8040726.1 hypothetical protein [Cellulosimicrobium sp. XJ-DQ-B-000]
MRRGPGALRATDVARLLPARTLPPSPPPGAYAPDAATPHLLDLARRAGHPEHRVRALATTLDGLRPADRRAVVDPLRRLDGPGEGPAVRPLEIAGAPARQTDGTTCGSAVLGLLAAAGDPVLALWLATGLRPGDAARHDRADARARGGVERFRTLQQALKRRTNRRALGPLPWPAALGTPPWGAARTARHADVRFVDRVVAGPGAERVVGAALAAAARGLPVPLFTGGDLALGLATAVPRHVVLLTDADAGAGWCRVYEPSSGTLRTVAAGALLDGARVPAVRRALGGWPHVCWALLPDGRAGEGARPAAGWAQPPRPW